MRARRVRLDLDVHAMNRALRCARERQELSSVTASPTLNPLSIQGCEKGGTDACNSMHTGFRSQNTNQVPDKTPHSLSTLMLAAADSLAHKPNESRASAQEDAVVDVSQGLQKLGFKLLLRLVLRQHELIEASMALRKARGVGHPQDGEPPLTIRAQ